MNSFSIIENTFLFKNGTYKHVFTTMTLTAPHTSLASLASISSSLTFTSPVRASWMFTLPGHTHPQPGRGQAAHGALPRSLSHCVLVRVSFFSVQLKSSQEWQRQSHHGEQTLGRHFPQRLFADTGMSHGNLVPRDSPPLTQGGARFRAPGDVS